MHIRRVTIRGIRGFGEQSRTVDLDLTRPDGTLAGWTVIAGRNGAGKTTFLQAIALTIAGARVASALKDSFAGWIRRGRDQGISRLTVVPDVLDAKKQGQLPDTLMLQMSWHPVMVPGLEGLQLSEEPAISTKPDLDEPCPLWAPQPSGWFAAGYGPFRRLTGHAMDAQRLRTTPGPKSRLASLFREEVSLGDCVEWLKDINHRKLEGKPGAQELEQSLTNLLDDHLLPDQAKIARIDSDGVWIQQGDLTLPLGQLSDGYRTVIALIVDIARQMYQCYGQLPVTEHDGNLAIDLPGVVLIDEVDSHLHVTWQQQIGFWLKRRFPKVQFLVTTHSPFICQAADPGGLIRLPGPGEDRNAEQVSERLYREIVNGSVEDAVLTDLFGLEHSRSTQAEHKTHELAALEAKLLRGHASESEIAQYHALKRELPLGPSKDIERVLLRLDQASANKRGDS